MATTGSNQTTGCWCNSNTSATQVTKDTHPLHQMTMLCHHTPPSLPSRPLSSAAGFAIPALQVCGMVKGASAGSEGRGHSAGPSPVGPRKRSDGGTLHYPKLVLVYSQSPFSSLHCLTSAITSLQIIKKCTYMNMSK